MDKIKETLHIGGQKKEGEAHKAEAYPKAEAHHKEEHKEGGGIVDKIKDKIHGDGAEHHGEGVGEKKKKKEKKKHEHGHEKHEHGHSSSSSDSD